MLTLEPRMKAYGIWETQILLELFPGVPDEN